MEQPSVSDEVREKRAEYMRAWRAANRDRVRERAKVYARAYRKANPGKDAARARKHREDYPERYAALQRKRAYGITPEQFDTMLAAQDALCAICRMPPRGKWTSLCVDHCHTTGLVRGLLCHPCNTMIGQAQESSSTLLSAVSYLASPPAPPLLNKGLLQ